MLTKFSTESISSIILIMSLVRLQKNSSMLFWNEESHRDERGWKEFNTVSNMKCHNNVRGKMAGV